MSENQVAFFFVAEISIPLQVMTLACFTCMEGNDIYSTRSIATVNDQEEEEGEVFRFRVTSTPYAVMHSWGLVKNSSPNTCIRYSSLSLFFFLFSKGNE